MSRWNRLSLAVLNILLGITIGGVIELIATQPRGEPLTLEPVPTLAPLVVHVTGEVKNPGLYELPPGSRVQDAILSAGGFINPDSENLVNLAGLLRDGQQVMVGSSTYTAPTLAPSEQRGMININRATQEELMSLPGVGETRAKDIITYRTQQGSFLVLEDLMNVKGIGQTTFDKLKPYITIGIP